MPIQIRELVVKVTVSEGTNQPAQSGTGSGQASSSSTANSELLQQCVEEVLEVLKRKKER
ncbi:MAG: hypothetical protein IPM82_25890 [Saprospiraceae bacterium]|nr:hypothetical protein [Saprospiraceae bacterium]